MSNSLVNEPRPSRDRYDRYINSKAWRIRRLQYLALEPVCQACGADFNLHVHHRSYERFGQEQNKDLRSLCQRCHSLVHDLATNYGRTLAAATDQVIAHPPFLASIPSGRRSTKVTLADGHAEIDLALRGERVARHPKKPKAKKPRPVKHVHSKRMSPNAKPLSQSEFDRQFAEAVAKRKARQGIS